MNTTNGGKAHGNVSLHGYAVLTFDLDRGDVDTI